MQQVLHPVEAETEVRKSRFIALVIPVTDRQEAQRHLAQIRQRFPDARHVCAVLLTSSDSMLDDDGEPSGTAAKPMYNVLRHKDIGNVLAVVVRYFGGIKLGAGGLVRAYSQALGEALLKAELVEVVPRVDIRVSCPPARESRLRHLCRQADIPAGNPQYEADSVILTLTLEAAQCDSQLAGLYSAMSGELTRLAPSPP